MIFAEQTYGFKNRNTWNFDTIFCRHAWKNVEMGYFQSKNFLRHFQFFIIFYIIIYLIFFILIKLF